MFAAQSGLDALCRIIAGATGTTRFGAHTTAHAVLAALIPAARRDPRLRRLVALLGCSVNGDPGPGCPAATVRWCERVLRREMPRADRLIRGIHAPGL
jgi:hypothetical protein